jgi:hypothetical protein
MLTNYVLINIVPWMCEDIKDFIKFDSHYSQLVDHTMLDVQTKQYGMVTVVSSIHVR